MGSGSGLKSGKRKAFSPPSALHSLSIIPRTHPLRLPIRGSSFLDSHSSRTFQTCNFDAPQILWLLPTRLDAIVHNIPPAPRGQVAHRHRRIVSSTLGLSFPELRRSFKLLSKASIAIAHYFSPIRTSCDSSSIREPLTSWRKPQAPGRHSREAAASPRSMTPITVDISVCCLASELECLR